jgi:UDP:flavonoid glycosyltransferase YjiC (YdhE family)
MPDLQWAAATHAGPEPRFRRRIVLTTFGSLGDLHPYVALALGLQARGHEAVIATSARYREKVEALGIGFRAVRPDHPDLDADVTQRLMDRRRGSECLIREFAMPALRESYEDTLAAAEGADLLVSHMLAYTTRLVAEKTGTPWASSFVQPVGLFSVYDPPVLPEAPYLAMLRPLGPAFHRVVFWCAKRSVRSWSEPWHRLRAEVGLPPTPESPLFEGKHSPSLVLALFSKLLADKQPDWPPQSVITGFPFYDGGGGLPPGLARFLDDGPPPVVFTLGVSAAMVAGPFYRHSAAAAKLLGRRAVLILNDPRNRPPALPDGVAAFDYAPFSELFPRAAVIVHAGGVGTSGLAMRSGRPTLVVPYAHDQPDNAGRVARLGIARIVPAWRYTAVRAAAELRHLLDNPVYAQRASEVAEQVRQEDGVRAASDALEGLLQRTSPAGAGLSP